MTIRYVLKIQYLGENYRGSQKQPNGNTIQNKLEEALCTLIKQDIRTIFSGRTDSGVSARCQSVHFDIEFEILDKLKFLSSLNAILPDDIRVFDIEKTDECFHVQKSAKFRHYKYVIRNHFCDDVFDKCVLHYPYKLDANRMDAALAYLVGVHDFSAFKSKSDNPACLCEIYLAQARRSSDNKYVIIDIIGNRFLYNMVRTIVGTLLLIEKNNLEPLSMLEILKSKDRSRAGITAPAVGLTLESVGYNNCLEYIKTNKNIGKVHK